MPQKIAGPYWVRTSNNGTHDVCGRHGAIVRSYQPSQLRMAVDDCRRLQAGYVTEDKRVRDCAHELLAALKWLHSGKGEPVDVAAVLARAQVQA
jgi:hypothetical protein